MFFEIDQLPSVGSTRICISTKCKNFISETTQVSIFGVSYDVHVQELGTWKANIREDDISSDSDSEADTDEDSTPSEHSPKEDDFETSVFDTVVEENMPVESPNTNPNKQTSPITSSDPSRPPGYEHFRSTQINSPSQSKKAPLADGFSVINELTRIVEVIGAMGYNVKPCRKAIQTLILRIESERCGSIFSHSEAHAFDSFIDSSGLSEIPMGGRLYTGMNKTGSKLSKLDRFLLSHDVTTACPDLKAIVLDILWSDHNPIL
ncbi:RNA-directed DNA polymerase, eukaryota, reverse transcriptase zinc-binding domain protein, partial [Tanacetum coccineum]